MTYELREASYEDDKPFLKELFSDVRAAEFAALALPEDQLKLLVDLQFKAQWMAFAAGFPESDGFIIWAGTYRIGRLLIHHTETEMRLVDMALLGVFRNSGVGTSIVTQLKDHAREHGVPLRLTVRSANPAKRLYERLGFIAIDNGDSVNTLMEWVP